MLKYGMAEIPKLMERSIRAAILRHARGWCPYPHVQVESIDYGHRVVWGDARDPLNANKHVIVLTSGFPSKRDFKMLSTTGSRNWMKQDLRMMENDPTLSLHNPRSSMCNTSTLALLSEDKCLHQLQHLQRSWSENVEAKEVLELVAAQKFSPANALHTAMDALAYSYGDELNSSTTSLPNMLNLYMRIALGHAIAGALDQSETAWACSVSDPTGSFKRIQPPVIDNQMSFVAWQEDQLWRTALVSKTEPVVYMQYKWNQTDQGLVLQDNANEIAGNYGFVQKQHQMLYDNTGDRFNNQKEALTNMLMNPSRIHPDDAWLVPMLEGFWPPVSFVNQYFQLVHTFQDLAHRSLSSHAKTEKGLAWMSCMSVQASLEEPVKDYPELIRRREQWLYAVNSPHIVQDTQEKTTFIFEAFL